MSMTREEILAAIKERVLSVIPDARVMLFGSRARGDWHEESDWDILVLTEQEVTDELDDKVFKAVYPISFKTFYVIQTVVANVKDWEHHPGWYPLWLSTKDDLVTI